MRECRWHCGILEWGFRLCKRLATESDILGISKKGESFIFGNNDLSKN